MDAATISVDEFQALEHKVLQTVELIKKEREARSIAEAEATAARAEIATARDENSAVQQQLTDAQAEIAELREKLASEGEAQSEVANLQRERDAVRLRVEKMMATMDELL